MWKLCMRSGCGGWLGQIRKDWTVRTIIPVTVICQVLKGFRHRLQFGDFRLQPGGV